MEREMCGYLEWNFNFGEREMFEFEMDLRVLYGFRVVVRVSLSFLSRLDIVLIDSFCNLYFIFEIIFDL